MTLKQAVGIFVRTFAALSGAALIAVQGYDWSSGDAIKNNGYVLGLALLAALVGALIAVGWAFVQAPSTTPIQAATRALVEKVVGGIGVVAFNSFTDVVEFGKLIPALVVAGVLAFGVTLLSYVSPPNIAPPSS